MVPTSLIVAVKQKTNFVSTVYTLVSWRLSFFVLFPLSLSALWAEQLSTLQIILFKSLGVWFNCFIRPMGTIKRINWVQITKQVGRWIWKICVVIALSFKCLLFNIGTLKFTVVPNKAFWHLEIWSIFSYRRDILCLFAPDKTCFHFFPLHNGKLFLSCSMSFHNGVEVLSNSHLLEQSALKDY